ncbi:cytochrome P450 [Aspergillus californicus]
MKLHPKLVILLLALVITSIISIRRFLIRRCELFNTYGNTFKVKKLQQNAILTIEPKNIKTILSLKFKDYGISHRLEPFRPLLGKGIFNTDGDHWSSSRALIRPSFAHGQVADLTLLEKLMQDIFLLLPRDGSTVDLQDLFFRYTIDSATDFLFGQSVGTLKSQSDPSFADAFYYAQKAVLMRATLGPLSLVYRDRKADECNRICREFVKQFVDEAVHATETKETKETKHRRHIFSHELASRISDKERILDELMNVLLAGRDTTASLLGNPFFMLAKNPAIWDKLRREVAVLQALRLHPVVQRNQREAIRDTVLPVGGGKGHPTDFYGRDAEEFCPERWEDGSLRPRWGYLPFNGGPRMCIGQRYALTEVSYVLVRIVQESQMLESRDLGAWEESLALTLCSRNGAQVGLVPA